MIKALVFVLAILPNLAFSDVVKPALIEINVYKKGYFEVELRVSIEALLSEIGPTFNNTAESPNAEKYDNLRILSPADLNIAFENFSDDFINKIKIKFDGSQEMFHIEKIIIPEPGYIKVPRISTIILRGKLPKKSTYLTWYYPLDFGTYAVRVKQVDKENDGYHWSNWQWVTADKESKPFTITEIANKPTAFKVIGDFIKNGFMHIIPKGLDHILFILGLFLFSPKLKPLIWQISMFTLAHTLTLGLSVYGLINPPSSIVEPLIALSIIYIAWENIYHDKLIFNRLLIIFLFGLLHGFGFANVLLEFDLQKNDFIKTLLGFNIGVELGQLVVVLIAWFTLGLWFGKKPWYRKIISVPLSLIISCIATYWFIERLDFQMLTSYF